MTADQKDSMTDILATFRQSREGGNGGWQTLVERAGAIAEEMDALFLKADMPPKLRLALWEMLLEMGAFSFAALRLRDATTLWPRYDSLADEFEQWRTTVLAG